MVYFDKMKISPCIRLRRIEVNECQEVATSEMLLKFLHQNSLYNVFCSLFDRVFDKELFWGGFQAFIYQKEELSVG
jgi:hypothetical protein